MSSAISNDLQYSKYVEGVVQGGSVTTQATQASCLRNREFILGILQQYLTKPLSVFEVGSGTADQTAFFCEKLQNVTWQPSDRKVYLPKISETIKLANLPIERVAAPVKFDIEEDQIEGRYDAAYASNIVHCIPWESTQTLFAKVSQALKVNGLFILYGPYNIDGHYTSTGNENFDKKLKAQDSRLGLRDIAAMSELAQEKALELFAKHDHTAANNYILVFRKVQPTSETEKTGEKKANE